MRQRHERKRQRQSMAILTLAGAIASMPPNRSAAMEMRRAAAALHVG
jgi:hypothetical protein